jgi:OOP family OmpA-OmpF porin
MKIKYLSSIIIFFISTAVFSQTVKDSTISNLNNYRWQVEASIGESRGISPYKVGYFSSDVNTKFGSLVMNSFDLGLTFNFSKLLDFKINAGFDRFTNKSMKSLPFETAQFRTTFQGVVNLNHVIKFQPESSRFKLLVHGGVSVSVLQKVENNSNNAPLSKDLNGGMVYGITPMYRISKKAYFFLDLSSFVNYRQNKTWDGSAAPYNENLYGKMENLSFGLNLSFGKQVQLVSYEEKNTQIKDSIINKRVESIENRLIDSDKDGVADYLDNEKNSLEGALVDSKGVMYDKNKNNVPDQIERYLEENYGDVDRYPSKSVDGKAPKSKKSTDYIKKLINDGYISVLFDYNVTKPSSSSSDSVNYIVIFLNNNPTAFLEIRGHSNEGKDKKANEKLSYQRAVEVKNILLKSGINENRIFISTEEEEVSDKVNASTPLNALRRVTFKIN